MTSDLGIVVFPEFFQTEGISQVLDNLQSRTKITALATSPYVMRPSTESDGGREPPIDGGAGSVRLLDRPLWGKRELFVRTSVAYEPDRALYAGLRYQPPVPDAHTRADGHLVTAALREARARGLRTYIQVQAAIPPGYRVQFGGPTADDEPLRPDGSCAPDRLDKNGSLASPHIRAYTAALLRDLIRAYPDIDGFNIDWPEYPPYTLDSAFLDFSAHAAQAATRLGLDFALMRHDAGNMYEWLTRRLKPEELARLSDAGSSTDAMHDLVKRFPGVKIANTLKSRLATECAAEFRSAVPGKHIVLRTFPPPWSFISGLDFAAMSSYADAFAVKLFTMHWPMMVGSWASRLIRDNPALGSRREVAFKIARIFDLADVPESFGDAIAEYPAPMAAHPVDNASMSRKIALAQKLSGTIPVHAMAHGYGPVADFASRVSLAWAAADRKVWINRYGYLANDKLDAIGKICV